MYVFQYKVQDVKLETCLIDNKKGYVITNCLIIQFIRLSRADNHKD